jgi:hypothetical protein
MRAVSLLAVLGLIRIRVLRILLGARLLVGYWLLLLLGVGNGLLLLLRISSRLLWICLGLGLRRVLLLVLLLL